MTALDHAPLATLVVRDRRVTYANQAALALTGYAREELVGRPYTDLVPPAEQARLDDRQQRRLRGEPAPAVYETAIRCRGGALRPVQVHAALVGDEVLLQALDLSGEGMRRLHLTALAGFGAAVQTEDSAEAVIRAVHDALAALALEGALFRPDGDALRLESARLLPERAAALEQALGGPLPGARRPWTALDREAWQQGAAHEDEWRPEGHLLAPGSLRGSAAPAPPVGVMAVRLERAGRPDALLHAQSPWLLAQDLPTFRLFGAQVSAALEAVRGRADLATRHADLAALARISEAASSAPDLEQFLARAAADLGDLLAADLIAFLRRDAARGEARLLRVDGGGPGAVELLAALPPERALAAPGDAPAVIQADAPGEDALLVRRLGLATAAAVPLRLRSAPVGAVVVGFTRPRPAAACRLELLQAMAPHFGAAIETHHLLGDLRARVAELTRLAGDHARLLEEARRHAEGLGVLLDVGRSVVATLELDTVLAEGARNLARIVGAPGAFLLLADAEGRELVIRSTTDPHAAMLGRRLPLTGHASLARLAFERRAPLAVEDARASADADPALREEAGARAFLVVPMVVRERAIGAAMVIETRATRAFTQAEVERAAAVANQLAVAVDNARLYEDLRRSYDALAQAQGRLVRRERLAALGELAAVVAHEVRNPLGAIFNSLGSLRRLLHPEGDARMLFDIVAEEADRLNRIVGDLLHFARPTPPALRPEPLAELVEAAVGAALGASGARVELVREIEALPPVPVDARLLRQAVLNVAQNALQAMPGGGTLTLRVVRAGPFARIELADTGPGMPAEARQRMFEPFFTTRATGTGLGLAIVKRIVEDHRGRVDVCPGPAGGTAVGLEFPMEG